MQIPQVLYILGSLALAYWLVNKAENKWFLSVVFFWLFSAPLLLDPRYTITLDFLGIDLQPNRILFLLLSTMLLFSVTRARILGKSLLEFPVHRFRVHEFWLMIYILIASVALVLARDELGMQVIIVNTIKLLTFLIVYLFARESISLQDFYLLGIAITTFATLSALVGVYQFFIDPDFFRIGASRFAFGSYMRGNGFFTSEYEQGLFLAMAFAIGMMIFREKWVKASLIIILPLGVFCTMHRVSWGILAILLGLIVVRELRRNYLWILVGLSAATLVVFLILNIPMQPVRSGTFVDQLRTTRVMDNTWEVRMKYNQFAVQLLGKYPTGIGNYESGLYRQEAYKKSMDFLEGVPLIIHNGFLSAGVLYGVAGMIAFSLFLFTTLLYYLRKELISTNIGFLVILIMISFFIINLTQDFSFLGDQIGLSLGLLIGAAISLHPDLRHVHPVALQALFAKRFPGQMSV